jgi:lipoyl(octanoyl) transferase
MARGGLAETGELLGCELLGCSHGSALADDQVHEKPLLLVGLERKEHLRVAYGNSALFEKGLCVGLEIQEPHGVGNRRAALSNALGYFVLGQTEITVQPGVSARLFDGIEVFSLQVLDQGQFEDFPVTCLSDDSGSLSEPKLARGPPSALPRDDFIFVVDPANDERLDDAAFANAVDQLLQVFAAKLLPRLEGARCYLVERQGLDALAELFDGRGSGNTRVDQRAESFAKCGFCHDKKMELGRMPEDNYMNARRCGFAMPLFNVIDLFLDETCRGGPEQMALDEALFECAERPVLRVYRWSTQAVSFGYSQSLAAVLERFPSIPSVRRWTGGGTVEHGCDWTFSLIVPFAEPLAKAPSKDTYRSIHGHVVTALNELGCSARLAGSDEGAPGMACFASPVAHDVIGMDQQKLCGGAQRRTRKGLLHQGSIQNVRLPADFAFQLLSLMAARTLRFLPSHATFSRSKELLAEKYATSAWLGRVS